jgi:hypothetical protein
MAEPKYDKLELVGLHEPDHSVEEDGEGNKSKAALPGVYHFGVVINGDFHSLATVKAPRVLSSLEKKKKAGKQQDDGGE